MTIRRGCKIPALNVRNANHEDTDRKWTHLEELQTILATLEHLADRRLLLAFSQIIHGFVNLDGRRQSRSLNRAHQMTAQSDTGLEEVRMSLDLLGSLCDCILTFTNLQSLHWVRRERLIRQDQE